MFCKFTLETILYKKVVPAMWSPFRDHIAGDHIKQVIVCNNRFDLLAKSWHEEKQKFVQDKLCFLTGT